MVLTIFWTCLFRSSVLVNSATGGAIGIKKFCPFNCAKGRAVGWIGENQHVLVFCYEIMKKCVFRSLPAVVTSPTLDTVVNLNQDCKFRHFWYMVRRLWAFGSCENRFIIFQFWKFCFLSIVLSLMLYCWFFVSPEFLWQTTLQNQQKCLEQVIFQGVYAKL